MGKIWRMSNDTKNTLYDKQKNQKMSVTYVSTLIHQTIQLFMYVCTKWKKKKKKIEIVFYGRNRVFRDPAKNMRITVSSRNLLWHDKTHRELLTCVEACILSSFSLAPSFSRVIWFHHGNGKYCTQFPLKLLSCNLIR